MIDIPKPELVDITKLKQNKANVKEHPEDQIKGLMELIKLEGFLYPLIIDKHNRIYAGHGRLLAAKKLGMKELPCVKLENLTKKELKAIMIMDNRINESAWNKDNLSAVLQQIPDFDFGKFEMDFSDDIIFDPKEETEPVPEPPKKPKTRLGDIYQLGNHRVMCGDCTKEEDVKKLLGDKTVNMIFTDAPYNVGYSSRGENKSLKIQNDSLNDEQFIEFLKTVFMNINQYLNDNCPVYLCHGDTDRKAIPFYEIYNICNWKRSCSIIWEKNNASMGWQDYRSQHEVVSYGWKGKSPFFTKSRAETTIWKIKRDDVNSYDHPTQKPVELPRQAVENSSRQNDIVLDPFLGSGSTLIACEQTNRVCRGMEIDPAYVDVCVQRWENYTNQKAKKI